jgi:putative DNA primase/helicase
VTPAKIVQGFFEEADSDPCPVCGEVGCRKPEHLAPDDPDRARRVTEDALATEFTRRHHDELLYVNDWGRWLRWTGTHWRLERTLAVFDLARTVAREAAATLRNEKLAAKVEAAATVAAIVTLARADRVHARLPEDFDTDPWVLNTPAGVIDLRTGETRPHRRTDMLTKVTAVSPGAVVSPLWLGCLRTWTCGDGELEAFLRRLAGYWLTGLTVEEILALFWGPGGNGKTKYLEAIRYILGTDYVTGVAMETLIITHGEQHPTDVADLRGKRLAVACETEEGRRLAEAKVKQLTGGDRLRARFMRRDFFEFDPTHKLVIVGNHKPQLRNVDDAMKRRLLLVPWSATIAPADRDPELAGKLRAEAPGILRWMLDGCAEWQRDGLRPPAIVATATEDYFATADVFQRWADDCLTFAPNATMPKAEAWESWSTWAERTGEVVGTADRHREWLQRRVDEARLGKARTRSWIGVGLRGDQ